MFAKLFRSTIFISIVKWAAPRVWVYIKKRRAAKKTGR